MGGKWSDESVAYEAGRETGVVLFSKIKSLDPAPTHNHTNILQTRKTTHRA